MPSASNRRPLLKLLTMQPSADVAPGKCPWRGVEGTTHPSEMNFWHCTNSSVVFAALQRALSLCVLVGTAAGPLSSVGLGGRGEGGALILRLGAASNEASCLPGADGGCPEQSIHCLSNQPALLR